MSFFARRSSSSSGQRRSRGPPSTAEQQQELPLRLVTASAKGDTESICAWLDAGGDIDATFNAPDGSIFGATLLMFASYTGQQRLVELLIDRSACVNRLTSHSGSALMEAAAAGHANTVSTLLNAGAAASRQALRVATSGNQLECSRIIQTHLDSKRLPLPIVAAAAWDNVPLVEQWLNGGGHVDATFDDPQRSMSHATLLIYASSLGHLNLVELLLRRGASIDLANSDGGTALMEADSKGHTDVSSRLLRAGARRLECEALLAPPSAVVPSGSTAGSSHSSLQQMPRTAKRSGQVQAAPKATSGDLPPGAAVSPMGLPQQIGCADELPPCDEAADDDDDNDDNSTVNSDKCVHVDPAGDACHTSTSLIVKECGVAQTPPFPLIPTSATPITGIEDSTLSSVSSAALTELTAAASLVYPAGTDCCSRSSFLSFSPNATHTAGSVLYPPANPAGLSEREAHMFTLLHEGEASKELETSLEAPSSAYVRPRDETFDASDSRRSDRLVRLV